MRFTPFHLVHGYNVITMLDRMLLPDSAHVSVEGTDQFVLHGEAVHQFARTSKNTMPIATTSATEMCFTNLVDKSGWVCV